MDLEIRLFKIRNAHGCYSHIIFLHVKWKKLYHQKLIAFSKSQVANQKLQIKEKILLSSPPQQTLNLIAIVLNRDFPNSPYKNHSIENLYKKKNQFG